MLDPVFLHSRHRIPFILHWRPPFARIPCSDDADIDDPTCYTTTSRASPAATTPTSAILQLHIDDSFNIGDCFNRFNIDSFLGFADISISRRHQQFHGDIDSFLDNFTATSTAISRRHQQFNADSFLGFAIAPTGKLLVFQFHLIA